MPEPSTAKALIAAAAKLRDAVDAMSFEDPVAYVYNPLRYAWKPHRAYLAKWGGTRKRVLLVGMNPGPWGMAQIGVPFGEVSFARDWVGIEAPVDRPPAEHPKRPVQGFACTRSEVSGRRLWGLFAERFGSAEHFFHEHFVLNYCPLMFMEESGRNRTPDKLTKPEQDVLSDACDRHLRKAVEILEPAWVVGVGAFAEGKARGVLDGTSVRIGRVLHPSPASPAANRGWAEAATRQLTEQGIW